MDYSKWKSLYVREFTSLEYYIGYNEQGYSGEKHYISTSEGHGYGMRICVCNGDKDIFDGLVKFYKRNLNSNGLMRWRQRVDVDGTLMSILEDTLSVTEGDLDIALSLLHGYELWGEKVYIDLGLKALDSIWGCCINKELFVPLLGDWVDQGTSNLKWVTRPSDFMLYHFYRFSIYHKEDWSRVLETCKEILLNFGKKYKTGLIGDFIVYDSKFKKWKSPRKKVVETCYDGVYYYSSCRVPLRLTEYYLSNKSDDILSLLKRLLLTFQKSILDSNTIHVGYTLEGKPLRENIKGRDLAFVAPVYWMLYVLGYKELYEKCKINFDSYFGDTLYVLGSSIVEIFSNDRDTVRYTEMSKYKLNYTCNKSGIKSVSWELNDQSIKLENECISMDGISIGDTIRFEPSLKCNFVRRVDRVYYSIIEVRGVNFDVCLTRGDEYLPLKIQNLSKDDTDKEVLITLDWHKEQLAFYVNKVLICVLENKSFYEPMSLVVMSKIEKLGVIKQVDIDEYRID